MDRILSTKKLRLNQKMLLLNANCSFVEYDAIKIEFIPFEVPERIQNAIFTSQNAVRSVFGNICSSAVDNSLKIQNCFCVGQKTASLLTKKDQNTIKIFEYGSDLASFIVKRHKNENFYFFCGNKRLETIPSELKKAKIEIIEIETYKTSLNLKKFHQQFHGILFFSPSGVQSYFEANNNQKSEETETQLFCIGETTATTARKYSENVIVSNATSIESVIAKAVKTLTTL